MLPAPNGRPGIGTRVRAHRQGDRPGRFGCRRIGRRRTLKKVKQWILDDKGAAHPPFDATNLTSAPHFGSIATICDRSSALSQGWAPRAGATQGPRLGVMWSTLFPIVEFSGKPAASWNALTGGLICEYLRPR